MIKEKRLSMNSKTFSLYNQQIYKQVCHHLSIINASLVACYVSLPLEVDTLSIIQELLKTKRIAVPKVLGNTMEFYEIHSLNDLKEGHFHVLEPTTNLLVKPQEIDCMLVPLVAFDERLYRVGYGKGYYDKYFASQCDYDKIGLAFEFQKVTDIQTNEFDIPLDEIITENNHYKKC